MNNKEYLAILAKAMCEDYVCETPQVYQEVYRYLNTTWTTALESSHYPSAPNRVKDITHLLDEMDSLFVIPALATHCTVLAAFHYSNDGFIYLKNLFKDPQIALAMHKLHTQIPFVILPNETERIEIINHVDSRIELSYSELQQLIQGSNANKVALPLIVKAIVIYAPLVDDAYCLLFDNYYHTADNLFGCAVARRVDVRDHSFSAKKAPTVSKRTPLWDAVVQTREDCDPSDFPTGVTFLWPEELPGYILSDNRKNVLGFTDEYRLIASKITAGYKENLLRMKAEINRLGADTVRHGASDPDWETVRTGLENRIKGQEEDYKALSPVLKHAETLLQTAEQALNSEPDSEKIVSRRVLDTVLEYFFQAAPYLLASQKDTTVRDIRFRLTTLHYPDLKLLDSYVQALQGKTSSVTFSAITDADWEKAKIYIELAQLDTLSDDALKHYVDVLQKGIFRTGKEYYARGLTQGNRNKRYRDWNESLRLGYPPVGEKLYDVYKKSASVHSSDIRYLAERLVPVACRYIALQGRQGPRHNDIRDTAFFYYKLAGATGDLESIWQITKTLFNCTPEFSNCDQPSTAKRDLRINGAAIFTQCDYLISKDYHADECREIKGVVHFCLRDNYKQAWALLTGLNNDHANFCKGIMYQRGQGTNANLKSAITSYTKVSPKSPKYDFARKKIAECQRKLDYEEQRRKQQSVPHAPTITHMNDNDDVEFDPLGAIGDGFSDLIGGVVDAIGDLLDFLPF